MGFNSPARFYFISECKIFVILSLTLYVYTCAPLPREALGMSRRGTASSGAQKTEQHSTPRNSSLAEEVMIRGTVSALEHITFAEHLLGTGPSTTRGTRDNGTSACPKLYLGQDGGGRCVVSVM